MPEKIYVHVNTDFDRTGYMRPRSITWKDGRIFKIDAIKDYRPASYFRTGMRGDCYVVEIRGETKYLFFQKCNPPFETRVGRWFVEKYDE